MRMNRMFTLNTENQESGEYVGDCLQVTSAALSKLWHERYGHLSYKGLHTLQNKQMVRGLPDFKAENITCVDCLNGKQANSAIPKRNNWRADKILELVHSDLCGPIQPISTSGKRCPTLAVKDMTPCEAWNGIKPAVDHFRVWGCLAHAHVPKVGRSKLDDRSITCIFLGVNEGTKGYRLMNTETKRIVICRDVIFEEDKCWEWEDDYKEQIKGDLEWNDDKAETGELDGHNHGEETVEPVTPVVSSPTSNTSSNNRGTQSSGEDGDFDQGRADTTQSARMDVRFCVRRSGSWPWIAKSIERNHTWTLIELPQGAKIIGVKWIYKTKRDENGEITKHKARLVAKGYTQQEGIDYSEVFAPIARMDTVRMVISNAAQKGWKSAFLHGELTEDVYVDQPRGYEVQGKEHQVYKLHKALYRLKQAPRAWYSRIEAHLANVGFQRCNSEQTLFTKRGNNNKIVVVSLYVDDLIYTGDDELILKQFKSSMMSEFEMTDLGCMNYFLGIEVT
ncbi:transmembrane signal receptor [Lithospermum erythrorhizon]|uniref:Transmembrane signal receptor n=1 Tax=Lithospermum erythrorhizon TaxID=34254 RepID=A0AAV3QS30_LITER